MTFYAVELDISPGYGWQGGPSGNTRIKPLKNRFESRAALGQLVQHTFTLPFQNITDDAYLQYLKAAHLAMWAQLHSFLVKDWLDFTVLDEALGAAPAGSTAVQLIKSYCPPGWAGIAPARVRNITKPVAGAVIKQAGVAKAGTLDLLTGLFTPTTAWTTGAALTWTGEFRVPVRFGSDSLPMTIDNKSGENHIVNGSVMLVEDFRS